MQRKTTEPQRPYRVSSDDAPVGLTFPHSRTLLILLIAIISLVSNPKAAMAQIQKFTLHFAFDSSNLSAHNKKTLQKAVANFDATLCQVTITGHTDTTGNLAYNHILSKERALSVQSFLIGGGVPEKNFKIEFFGENAPVNPDDAAINRRVEVQITCPETSSDIRELFSLLAPPAEIFTVNADRDTVLVTEGGTLLYIRKNSFGISPWAKDRYVQLLVRDRRKKSSLIRENLTTVSPSGDLYTSQLMLHIDAKYQGYRPVLKRDITVFSPADTIIPGIRLLSGSESGADKHIEWVDPFKGRAPVYNYRVLRGPRGSNFITPDTVIVDSTYRSMKSFYTYQYDPCNLTCKICKSDILYNTRMCRRLRAERFASRDSTLLNRSVVDSVVTYHIPRGEYIALIQMNQNRGIRRYEELDRQFDEMDSESLRDISRNDLEYYTFNTRYGWSNLDWLNKIPDPVNFSVNIKPDKDTKLRLVFRDQRSIVPLYSRKGSYYFDGLPRGERAWLVGLRYREKTPLFVIREITITEEGIDDLEFEEVTITELKERLKLLDQ